MGAVATMAAALLLTPAALAVDEVNTKKLRKGVTTAGVLEHMRTLQRLANANDGNRAATTTGYEASLDYVERRMKRAGYKVSRDEFPFAAWEQIGPATLMREGQPAYTEGPPEGGGDYIGRAVLGLGQRDRPGRHDQRHRARPDRRARAAARAAVRRPTGEART